MESGHKIYKEVLDQLRSNPERLIRSLPKELILKLLKYTKRKQYLTCGFEQTFLTNPDGKIFCFGSNTVGQLGIGSDFSYKNSIIKNNFLEKQEVISISTSGSSTFFVTKTGEVFNSGISLNKPFSIIMLPIPAKMDSLQNERIISTSAGDMHAIFLSDQGAVFSYGSNDYLQAGQDNTDKTDWIESPTKIKALNGKKISFVACSSKYSIFLDNNGAVFFCGLVGATHKLGTKPTTPILLLSLQNEKIIFASTGSLSDHTILLNNKGESFCFGNNENGQLGTQDKEDRVIPIKIEALSNEKIVFASTSRGSSILINDKGELIVFGDPYIKYINFKNRQNTVVIAKYQFGYKIKLLDNRKFVQVACAEQYSVLLDEIGRIFIWGKEIPILASIRNSLPAYKKPLFEPTLVPNFNLFAREKKQRGGGVDYFSKYWKYKNKYMSLRM